ncbi:hypothetical protein [Vibrio phage vB_pir03]|nr:hypothetical protein [Vibrio phage vB_pir03]
MSHNMAIASMFGKPSTGLQNAIQQIHQSYVGTAVAATGILQQVQQKFHDLNFGTTAKIIDSMRAKNEVILQAEPMRLLVTLGDFQHANSKERRVIMATPVIREEYQAGNLRGYGDLYVNASPTGVGSSHYDYRAFTSGVVQTQTQEDGTTRSQASWYYESHKEEQDLSIAEKRNAAVLMTTAAWMIDETEYDLTSPENDLM